jgi:hypothetical protein
MKGEHDLPDNILLFRNILNSVKRKILETNNPSVSSTDCLKRILQFGNIVVSLLKDPSHGMEEQTTINDLFKKYEFHLDKLSESDRTLCEYYVNNDVHTYTFDLNPTRFD